MATTSASSATPPAEANRPDAGVTGAARSPSPGGLPGYRRGDTPRSPAPAPARFGAGARARLGTRDKGAGIPEEMWADAAHRFRKSAGVSPTSAGLGLAIVDEVARAHGGQMRFAHAPGGGFEVFLDLPLE